MAALLLLSVGLRVARADDELDYGLEQRLVASITIDGAESFEDSRIKDLLPFGEPHWYMLLSSPHYTEDLLLLGVDAVRSFYRAQGFHAVTVDGEATDRDSRHGDKIAIHIVEGPRTLISSIRFTGNSPLDEDELIARLVHPAGSPAPFVKSAYGRDVYALRSAHLARGFLGTKIQFDMDENKDKVALTFHIDTGPAYHIERIDVEGNREVRGELIRREFRFAPGDIFDLDKIVRTESDLLETGWFRDVGFTPVDLDTLASTCALNLHVVERNSGYYEVGVGAGDNSQLRLTAAWGDRNFFRSGKGLNARVRLLWGLEDILDIDRRIVFDHREELNYVHRRLFGSRYTMTLSGFFDRQSRGSSGVAVEKLGLLGSTTLWRYRARSLELELSHERVRKVLLSQVKDLSPADGVLPQVQTGNSTTNSVLLLYTRDTRNSLFEPSDGSLRQILWQTAGGPVFAGDNSFHKAVATWAGFFGHEDGSVLALRMQAGWATPWYKSGGQGVLGVPLENRFFAGGQRSVRGYRENSLGPRLTQQDQELVLDDRFLLNHPAAGGEALLVLNAELRLPFPLLSRWGFGLILFADGGNVWEDWSKVKWKDFRLVSNPEGSNPTTIYDFRTGVGFGFLYHTPVGPLRLEYGLPQKRVKLVGEDGSTEIDQQHIWHFSLGFAF
jgi:outer membrane protein insertion porin family